MPVQPQQPAQPEQGGFWSGFGRVLREIGVGSAQAAEPERPAQPPQAQAAPANNVITKDWLAGIASDIANQNQTSSAQPAAPPVNIGGGAGSGGPRVAAAQEQSVRGSANITVRFANRPPGTTTTANATGPLWGGPPLVEDAMAGYGF